MRYQEIMELAGVKRFKDMSASDIINYIKKNLGNGPVELLGKGSQGVAVKIGGSVYKFWMVDSAYTVFVKYALQHQDNPFLPKFLSGIKQMPAFFARHKKAPDYVNYIKMEELSDNIMYDAMTTVFYFEIPPEVLANNKTWGDPGSFTMEEILDVMKFMDTSDDPYQKLADKLSSSDFPLKAEWMTDKLKMLVKTLYEIMQLGYELDLHEDNILWRRSQMVLLDPIYDADDHRLNAAFKRFDSSFKTKKGGKPAVQSKFAQTQADQQHKDNSQASTDDQQ